MGGNAFSNRGLFDASGKARQVSASVKSPVRRREMPIVAADEARHYANVANLDCQRCGSAGPSQVAHSNQLGDDKGKSFKAPWWLVAALCPACHVAIDSGNRLTKAARREEWDAAYKATTAALFARGLLRPTPGADQ